ncbi:DUF2225 domain-containing protein, partial [bacterium]|nr:DUF2225 domain-containing protein [bacterium]
YELQLTAEWQELRSTGQLPGVPDAELDLALAWLYRSRGELVAAESWLDRAALSDSALPERYTLYRYLRSSIRLEQSYLRVCEQWLGNAWNGGEVITAEQGGVAYLLGEISRRLGDFSKAFSWYERAGTMNRGALSPELIERQLALVRDGRGY